MLDTPSRHHLARVVFVYADAHLDQAVADFSTALGIDFGPILTPPGMGLRVAASLSTGIELVAPTGTQGHGAYVADVLAQKGDGAVLGVVYRVPDLEEALARAAAAGCPEQGDRIDCFTANPDWANDYASLTEANLSPIGGVTITLIEGVPAAGREA